MTVSRFSQWSALSPWSIVSFSFGTIKAMLNNGYALIPVVYTGWQKGFSSPWVIVAILAVISLTLGYSVVQWLKYRYRLHEGKLGIHQGLLYKRAHEIPLNRIQNVRLEQPLYFRPMGLYSLVVETAGSKKDEAVLAAVNYRQALQLKQRLFSQQQPSTSDEANGQTQQVQQVQAPIVKKSLKDIVLFGLYQNNLIWFSVISGSILGQLDWESSQFNPVVEQIQAWYSQVAAISLLGQIAITVFGLVLLYLLLSLISIAAAILKYHPYQLSLKQRTVHRTGGIIAKQNDALKLKRVQLVRFSQPVIGRLLKLWTVSFRQVQGNEVEGMAQRHMLVPSMTRQQITQLLSTLSGLTAKAKSLPSQYQSIDIGWFWRRMWLPPLIATANVIGVGLNPFTEILIVVALLFVLGLYLRYRHWGYLIQGNDCWIHSGMLSQNWNLVALRKVQHVEISQTAGQRKKQLASITLGLASGEQHIPYIPLADARIIAERALSLTQQDHQNWI
ncbi:PH domain-containing protein [Shewanella waksmanii]|uniref:PH domain-containing protein n=1 Tax=Shewanella waksmanii TaxID=213783 RepID=UPI0037366FA4